MSPRPRSTPDEGGDAAVHIGTIAPPPRKRERKITLPADVLTALQEAISTETWTGNGVEYDGEDAAKDATTAARIYRRDLARHMQISERRIRTRVWEVEGEKWLFALRLRDENGNGASA